MNGGRRGAGHFLRRRTYRNKELCCLVQRAAMVGLGGCRESRMGVRVWSGRRQAGRQAGTRVAEAECSRRSDKHACPGSSRMIRFGGGGSMEVVSGRLVMVVVS